MCMLLWHPLFLNNPITAKFLYVTIWSYVLHFAIILQARFCDDGFFEKCFSGGKGDWSNVVYHWCGSELVTGLTITFWKEDTKLHSRQISKRNQIHGLCPRSLFWSLLNLLSQAYLEPLTPKVRERLASSRTSSHFLWTFLSFSTRLTTP